MAFITFLYLANSALYPGNMPSIILRVRKKSINRSISYFAMYTLHPPYHHTKTTTHSATFNFDEED